MNDIYYDGKTKINTYDHAINELNMWDFAIGDEYKQNPDTQLVGHLQAEVVRINIPTFFTPLVFARLVEQAIKNDCSIDYLVNCYLTEYMVCDKCREEYSDETRKSLYAISECSKFIPDKSQYPNFVKRIGHVEEQESGE